VLCGAVVGALWCGIGCSVVRYRVLCGAVVGAQGEADPVAMTVLISKLAKHRLSLECDNGNRKANSVCAIESELSAP
jgi:hypothetical protein